MLFSICLYILFLSPTWYSVITATARLSPYQQPQLSHTKTVIKDDLNNDIFVYTSPESITQFIQDVTEDLHDLERFYDISISHTRTQRLGEYLAQRTNELYEVHLSGFDDLDQEGKVDCLLIRNYIARRLESLRAQWTQIQALDPFLGSWSKKVIELYERRQNVVPTEGKYAAQLLCDANDEIIALQTTIANGESASNVTKFTAYRAVQAVYELNAGLWDWFGFYDGYDPIVTWWVERPFERLSESLRSLASLTQEKLVGVRPGDEDAIIGQPSGRESILADLEAEMIPYSPEELLQIADTEYKWCEKEMIAASTDIGYGKDWKRALEHVKNMYIEPGQQAYLVHDLAEEAVKYVTDRDMVTIPAIVNETWRTFMMPPEQQKVLPFFAYDPSHNGILVAYPSSAMDYEDRRMIMRGNSRPISRSTVFHELLPGHALQYSYMSRYKTHRRPFMTPFWTEGWAFYWEMILWDRGFPGTPENKIGMLFWRMQRCARIQFSLRFHLGQWTPEECIDYLIDKVGHERATAEGEVRRSFNGYYTPLYQAGYMIGALQFYALREELVDTGHMTEKRFHDAILKENNMPVEMVRALLKNEPLEPDQKPSWKFYGDLSVPMAQPQE